MWSKLERIYDRLTEWQRLIIGIIVALLAMAPTIAIIYRVGSGVWQWLFGG